MLHVETVNLADFGVNLPSGGVGMVIAQPFLHLSQIEPYRCTDAEKELQLNAIRCTLEVAQRVEHGAEKTHFTIFPEYSIPGIEGIGIIDDVIKAEDWPKSTLVIGGIDALTKDEFSALANSNDTYLDVANNSLERIGQNEWINCCVTWAKGENGQVSRWLQPKLVRAWAEQNIVARDMFLGNSVYLFKGMHENQSAFRFSTLVCFDWIGSIGGQKVWQSVVTELHQQAAAIGADRLALTWLFVIQRNPRPSHPSFLNQVSDFFDQRLLNRAGRDQSCLVFANCAGNPKPGRTDEYGGSSLVFSAQTLYQKMDTTPPTNSNGGESIRESKLLEPYKDALFRERGACIHSFFQVNPNSLAAGAENRATPLTRPYSFPIDGCIDPRVPSDLVPACIKWLNDELDSATSLGGLRYETELEESVIESHGETITKLRSIEAGLALKLIRQSTVECKCNDADSWGHDEVEGLEHLVNTLDIFEFGLASPVMTIGSESAEISLEGGVVDLIAVRGLKHEDCLKHFDKLRPVGRRPVMLISRDRLNSQWDKRFGSILDKGRLDTGGERNFTNATSGTLHLDFNTLLSEFQCSSTRMELKGKIDAFAVA